MDDRRAKPRWKSALAWTVVYAGNLIFPLVAGGEVTRGFSRAGMWIAGLAYWGLGIALIGRRPRLVLGLTLGGIFVGMSQVLPIPQIEAGCLALLGWRVLSGNTGANLVTIADGLVVTALTGGMLLLLAGVLGNLILRIDRWSAAAVAANDRPPDRDAFGPKG